MTTETQPLPTDAEIEAAWTDATGSRILPYPDDMLAFARAVLAKWGTPAPVGVGPAGEIRASSELGVAPYADIWPWLQPDTKLYTADQVQAADSVLEDAARLERERICAAIKAEDDYCVEHSDYMLDSDDCIKIVRGEWVRPDYLVDTARKQGGA